MCVNKEIKVNYYLDNPTTDLSAIDNVQSNIL